jgi:methylglutaconyl-CoA hydratase
MSQEVLIEQEGAVARVTLNRPQRHNAMTPALIDELRRTFLHLGGDESVRVIVLSGNGKSFCAGADLGSMRAAADFSFEENVRDGQEIFDLMATVDRCPKPVVGRVTGAAIGGGAGLVSCCDVAAATADTIFAFSETRLGIVPAVISPFVVSRIGKNAARELFLSGERFTAERARQEGLIQYVVHGIEALDARVAERVAQFLQAAPGAQATVKALLRELDRRPYEALRAYTSEVIARRRASDEGREGMSAFLEKRKPWWQA